MLKTALRLSCLLAMSGAVIVTSSGCAGARVKPAGQTLIICASRFARKALPRQAAVVRALRQRGPVVWMVDGSVFQDPWATACADGSDEVRLLGTAGVDAVLLTPDWLSFGLHRQQELVNSARFYVLGANLLDSAGQSLGHPFMVKRTDEADVALTGLWLDSADTRLRLRGVRFVSPDFAAHRASTLMRQRADVIGALVPPADSVSGWGLGFVCGAGSRTGFSLPLGRDFDVRRLDLTLLDGRIVEARQVQEDSAETAPDSAVARMLDSLERGTDSFCQAKAADLPKRLAPAELTRWLVQGFLATGEADGFLYDSLPVRYALGPGELKRRTLIDVLSDPRRLALIPLSGNQIKAPIAGKNYSLELRPGLPRALPAGRTYRIAATQEFLKRHPELAVSGYDLTVKEFWTIAADVLQSPFRR
jgi:hypothetical protein